MTTKGTESLSSILSSAARFLRFSSTLSWIKTVECEMKSMKQTRRPLTKLAQGMSGWNSFVSVLNTTRCNICNPSFNVDASFGYFFKSQFAGICLIKLNPSTYMIPVEARDIGGH